MKNGAMKPRVACVVVGGLIDGNDASAGPCLQRRGRTSAGLARKLSCATMATSDLRAAFKRLLHEPLVHFLALGAALFVLYALVNPGAVAGRTTRIDVGPSELGWIETTWLKQNRRAPTEAELKALVDDYVRDEVLYREALAMGLDRDDI